MERLRRARKQNIFARFFQVDSLIISFLSGLAYFFFSRIDIQPFEISETLSMVLFFETEVFAIAITTILVTLLAIVRSANPWGYSIFIIVPVILVALSLLFIYMQIALFSVIEGYLEFGIEEIGAYDPHLEAIIVQKLPYDPWFWLGVGTFIVSYLVYLTYSEGQNLTERHDDMEGKIGPIAMLNARMAVILFLFLLIAIFPVILIKQISTLPLFALGFRIFLQLFVNKRKTVD